MTNPNAESWAILHFTDWDAETLIKVANAMSEDIDRLASEPSDPAEHPHRRRVALRQTETFSKICAYLEAGGVALADHVLCPKYPTWSADA